MAASQRQLQRYIYFDVMLKSNEFLWIFDFFWALPFYPLSHTQSQPRTPTHKNAITRALPFYPPIHTHSHTVTTTYTHPHPLTPTHKNAITRALSFYPPIHTQSQPPTPIHTNPHPPIKML